MKARSVAMLAVLAARMFGESQGAVVEQKAQRKSGKKKWIIIGAVAGGAAVGYAIAAKRLGNEGIRIFPALR